MTYYVLLYFISGVHTPPNSHCCLFSLSVSKIYLLQGANVKCIYTLLVSDLIVNM